MTEEVGLGVRNQENIKESKLRFLFEKKYFWFNCCLTVFMATRTDPTRELRHGSM
jgi:hypothetical protein